MTLVRSKRWDGGSRAPRSKSTCCAIMTVFTLLLVALLFAGLILLFVYAPWVHSDQASWPSTGLDRAEVDRLTAGNEKLRVGLVKLESKFELYEQQVGKLEAQLKRAQLGSDYQTPSTVGEDAETLRLKRATAGDNPGGAVYVRWGRTTCPPSSSLVYDGVAGGTYFANSGGGAEKLCLPLQPEWGKFTDGFRKAAYIHGAEYQMRDGANVVFSTDFTDGTSLNQHNVPCAVCMAAARPSKLMIPAKMTCPKGWTTEYSGYLMSERYSHHRSSFDCMDEAPEIVPGGEANENGALFFHVEAQCGSLPCPDYVSGRELTCAVCTK